MLFLGWSNEKYTEKNKSRPSTVAEFCAGVLLILVIGAIAFGLMTGQHRRESQTVSNLSLKPKREAGLIDIGSFPACCGVPIAKGVILIDGTSTRLLALGRLRDANERAALFLNSSTMQVSEIPSPRFSIVDKKLVALSQPVEFDRSFRLQSFPFIQNISPFSGASSVR